MYGHVLCIYTQKIQQDKDPHKRSEALNQPHELAPLTERGSTTQAALLAARTRRKLHLQIWHPMPAPIYTSLEDEKEGERHGESEEVEEEEGEEEENETRRKDKEEKRKEKEREEKEREEKEREEKEKQDKRREWEEKKRLQENNYRAMIEVC